MFRRSHIFRAKLEPVISMQADHDATVPSQQKVRLRAVLTKSECLIN